MELFHRHVKGVLLVSVALLVTAGCFSFALAGKSKENLDISDGYTKEDYSELVCEPLKIMTLNTAHGRKDAFSQLFASNDEIKQNLDDIAHVIGRENPHIIALQEADNGSFWSGGFNHVSYLAEKESANFVQGSHVSGFDLNYGTAIISRLKLQEPVSFTFEPTPPTPSKGFVLSSVALPSGKSIDVISLHLDFISPTIRKLQAEKVAEEIRKRNKPVIVMGDFNSKWSKNEESVIREFANALGLETFNPEDESLHTFRSTSERIDWILVSPDIKFLSYRVLDDKLSDHNAIVSEIIVL